MSLLVSPRTHTWQVSHCQCQHSERVSELRCLGTRTRLREGLFPASGKEGNGAAFTGGVHTACQNDPGGPSSTED